MIIKKPLVNQRAFTLIELLVVISIIALLMSVLMPALNKARKQAQAVVCASKQRTFALIASVYTNDFKGFFPIAWMPPSRYGKAYDNTHANILLSYGLKPAEGSYYCPSDKPEPSDSCKVSQIGTKGIQGKYSYQYNLRFGGWGLYPNNQDFSPRRTTEIKRSSQTVLLAEDRVSGNALWFERPWDFTFFHNGFMNIVLADCHTIRIKAVDAYTPGTYNWTLDSR